MSGLIRMYDRPEPIENAAGFVLRVIWVGVALSGEV